MLENDTMIKIEAPTEIKGKMFQFDIFFDKDDDFVDIYCENICKFKKEQIADTIAFVNAINMEYRGVTLYIKDNDICIKSSILTSYCFAPETVFVLMNVMSRIIEKLQ